MILHSLWKSSLGSEVLLILRHVCFLRVLVFGALPGFSLVDRVLVFADRRVWDGESDLRLRERIRIGCFCTYVLLSFFY
jgi:hypothetical protein